MNRLSAFIVQLISPIIWFITLIICICFWIYRKTIHLVLKFKYGNRYGGLMDFNDAFAATPDKNQFKICTVLINKCNRKIDLLQFLRDRFRKEIESHEYPKLTSTLHFYRGYAFWLKGNIDIEECVKTLPMPEHYDETFIKTTASRLYRSKFPYDDTLMWDMLVADNPMIEKTKEGTCYKYAAILRLHHVIGDGTTKGSLLSRIYGRDPSLDPDNIFLKKLICAKSACTDSFFKALLSLYMDIAKSISLAFYLLFLFIQRNIEQGQGQEEENILHGPELSGDKFFVWATEKAIKFVPLTKKIKNSFTNMKFSHVTLTAVTIGIARFLEKRNKQLKVVPMFMPVPLTYPRIIPNYPIPLENKSSSVIVELPTGKTGNLHDTLMKVKEICEGINPHDLWSQKFIAHRMLALLPISVRCRLMSIKTTGVFTVLPAGSRNVFLNDCYIESILASSPHFKKMGFTTALTTYDDRYNIGVMVDQNLIENLEDAQEIADEILGSFQLLYVELKEKGLIME